MESPSFFFVQTVNHYQSLSTTATPVMTLSVYANEATAVAKLDFSIQFVCSPEAQSVTIAVDLLRDSRVLNSHLIQFDPQQTKREDNFIVTTDSMTWSDNPPQGINLYHVAASVLSEDGEGADVFAGSRSFNATVFA